MRQILIPTLLIALHISTISPAESKPELRSAPCQIEETGQNRARPGFYLEIKRSYVRAYPGWQKKTIDLLRSKRLEAFNGDPKNQRTVDNLSYVEYVEKTSKPRLDISPVFIGPYKSAEAAERGISELLSALKPLIEFEKKDDGLHNRALFLVGVVRVQ